MNDPHAHCGFCGQAFLYQAWPRRCEACGQTAYRNPLPVAVLLVPVGDGALLVQRTLEPQGLALPGGFIEYGEDWRAAAARELAEETGLWVDAQKIRELAVHSAPDGSLLVFGIAPAIEPEALAGFMPTAEVAALHVGRSAQGVVFALHAQVLEAWLATR